MKKFVIMFLVIGLLSIPFVSFGGPAPAKKCVVKWSCYCEQPLPYTPPVSYTYVPLQPVYYCTIRQEPKCLRCIRKILTCPFRIIDKVLFD